MSTTPRLFWEEGIAFFSLHRIQEGGTCECGDPDCPAVGKHPRTKAWQHSPLWSEEQVENMEEFGWLDTGYGVLLNGPDAEVRLLVVDVDARNGGVESFDRLVEKHPQVGAAGLIVETGSGGGSRHLYFKLPNPAPALLQSLPAYPGIDFKSTGYVVGPGSLHASGRRYETLIGSPSEIEPVPGCLLELLDKPERHRATTDAGTTVDVSLADLREMLDHVENGDATDYETWLRVGMALHHTTNGDPDAFQAWLDWSARSPKHDPSKMDRKWHSFGKSVNPVTFGTLAHYAEEGGWIAPVTFTEDTAETLIPPDTVGPEDEIDTTGIDLKRPPGFVGRLTAWINSCCLYPREHLAVAAALQAVAGSAGLRYIDPVDRITPNLFTFCVAKSSTGKEPVEQALRSLYRAAGVAKATQGGIKSEQEIYRNLIEHQAALYVVDELGEQLAKIANAMKRGGAPYLEGIIGTLMSAYTKTNGYLGLTGDLKRELQADLQKKIAATNKLMDEEGEKPHLLRRVERLERRLADTDDGLPHPYLCVMGLTTPEKFEALMTYEMASSGFLGRAILFREHETNPWGEGPTERYDQVPPDIAQAMSQLYSAGHADMMQDRIEWPAEQRIDIPTDRAASAMLKRIRRIFWERAEEVKADGLEPIPRRGYELVAKVSMILGIPGGVRREEHVRWAYALVDRDLRQRMHMVKGNEGTTADALQAKILGLIPEEGEIPSVIKRAIVAGKKFRKEDVEKMLAKLVEAGKLREEPHQGKRGRPTVRYFLPTK